MLITCNRNVKIATIITKKNKVEKKPEFINKAEKHLPNHVVNIIRENKIQ